MPKLVARRTDAAYWVGQGRFPIRTPKLFVAELTSVGIIRLQGRAEDPAFVQWVVSASGIGLPAFGRFAQQGEVMLASSSPTDWLVFCPLEREEALLMSLREGLGSVFATASVISDSRVGFQIFGEDAAEFIAKGCALDLHAERFPPAAVATTRFAGLPCMVIHDAAGHYRLHVDASYQHFMVDWLLDAAAEWSSAI